MADIAVGEKDKFDVECANEVSQFTLPVNGDIFLIGRAGQFMRIAAARNKRYLRGGEGSHPKFRVFRKKCFEVVKVPTRGSHDDAVEHAGLSAPFG